MSLSPEELRAALSRLQFVVFDFDGVFTDNRVLVSEDGKESVWCNRSDGFGLQMLRRLGVEFMILSTEVNNVVQARARKLKTPCVNACEDKRTTLAALLKEKGIAPENTAFLGNDINDVECMASIGLPVAVADAYPEAKAVAKLVLSRDGGFGAVREFCELVVQARQ